MSTNVLSKIPSAQTVVTTTELAVFSTPVLATGPGNMGIWISGDVQITPGTGTTAVTIRGRFGVGITGFNFDSTPAIPVTAGVPTNIPYNFFDTSQASSEVGGLNYSVTVQQTGASANGTVNGGHVGVEI